MDIEMWWPKLKFGGVMAGHDYLTQFDLSGILTSSLPLPFHLSSLTTWIAGKGKAHPGWDYALNYDGTRDELGRAVRGAVDEFFSDATHFMRGCPIQVTISYLEMSKWNSWAVRKPFSAPRGAVSSSHTILKRTGSATNATSQQN